MTDIIVGRTPVTRQQAKAWQVLDGDNSPVTLWLPNRSRCWSWFTLHAARRLMDTRGGYLQQATTRTIKDAVVTWEADPAVHECGIRFDGAPPRGCIDPAAHRGYAIVAPRGGGGNLTGAQLEDGAAAIARTFNGMGIQADPGRFGGAVLYPTREQALVILGLLEQARAVVRGPDGAR